MRKVSDNKGFTLIELLISMAILGLVLAALASLFAGTNRSYSAQSMVVTMQGNARAAVDFITRSMKGLSTTTAINETACNSSITFTSVEDFGMSSGSSSTTLIDNTKSWTADGWKNFSVTITAGTGSGQTRTISFNTATRLTVSSDWTTVPDNTSEYRVLSTNAFSLSANTLRYARNASDATSLAENITCFTLQRRKGNGQPATNWTDTARIDIVISAETPTPRPDTGTKGTLTLRSSVDLRN
ncbi:MAG: prepilin-type N-terminal cleavage/methylation domain-containing protein [Candidatus Subteraquimicrobiales bacterium]|nr:prepilin-type N-terminal cleavage/methylation domain-containing protein [Candidatus Subteraquimicrobiales bacterium]